MNKNMVLSMALVIACMGVTHSSHAMLRWAAARLLPRTALQPLRHAAPQVARAVASMPWKNIVTPCKFVAVTFGAAAVSAPVVLCDAQADRDNKAQHEALKKEYLEAEKAHKRIRDFFDKKDKKHEELSKLFQTYNLGDFNFFLEQMVKAKHRMMVDFDHAQIKCGLLLNAPYMQSSAATLKSQVEQHKEEAAKAKKEIEDLKRATLDSILNGRLYLNEGKAADLNTLNDFFTKTC